MAMIATWAVRVHSFMPCAKSFCPQTRPPSARHSDRANRSQSRPGLGKTEKHNGAVVASGLLRTQV